MKRFMALSTDIEALHFKHNAPDELPRQAKNEALHISPMRAS
jgi:hypothetical protein